MRVDEVEVGLLSIRYCLLGGSVNVWLCTDGERWDLIAANEATHRPIFGRYARGLVGKGDCNCTIRNLAEHLVSVTTTTTTT